MSPKLLSLTSIVLASVFFEVTVGYDRRSLLPFYIKRRMCEIDETLLLCKKKEPAPKPTPYSVFTLCDDYPNMKLCKYQPEKGVPLPTVAPPNQRALETFEQRFETVKPSRISAALYPKTTTTTMKPYRFDGRLRFPERETQRNRELRDRAPPQAPKEENTEESSFIANENLFDSLRILN